MIQPLPEIAFANLPVHRIDRGCMDPDQDVAMGGIRLRRVSYLSTSGPPY